RPVIMFPMKQPHRPVKLIDNLAASPLFAGTLVMNDRRLRIVINDPACLLQPVAPVDILPIHEKLFIQTPNLINRLSPNNHERPNVTVDFRGFVGMQMPQMILIELRMIRKPLRKTRNIIERSTRGRKTTTAGFVQS